MALSSTTSVGEIHLFADDVTFFSTDTNIESLIDYGLIDKMNLAMQEIYSWCQKYKLPIHPWKSEAIIMMETPFVGQTRPIALGQMLSM